MNTSKTILKRIKTLIIWQYFKVIFQYIFFQYNKIYVVLELFDFQK